MVKVITYGTYDLLHYGHIKLLERAKALGDYLIVGVTADGYDKTRGKINVQQSLMERIEGVRRTGLADEIIVEEYQGQKIDDILRMKVDIFTVGSDWTGKFDYLNEYCKVVYLDRTQGVSSSEIRSHKHEIRLGLVGDNPVLEKFVRECAYVDGIKIMGMYAPNSEIKIAGVERYSHFRDLLSECDALYVISNPSLHYTHIKEALLHDKHVLYESPLSMNVSEAIELIGLANERRLALYAGIKTAYSTAYSRLILLVKSGAIGDIVSIDATCTSLRNSPYDYSNTFSKGWSSIAAWGPTSMLPVFQLLGTEYTQAQIITKLACESTTFDLFTQINFIYPHSVATVRMGKGVKSEGELVIGGTKGYIYVPAPWWKLDYFECRYENPNDNKRYFYQLDGEGIRYEIVSFVKAITDKSVHYVSRDVSIAIVRTMENFIQKKNIINI